MTTLLQINSSLSGEQGHSTSLSNSFVESWRVANPEGRVIARDLGQQPVPHLDGQRLHAFITPAENRTIEQKAIVDYSNSLIEELRAADVVVFGVPMYNFGIPSTLKAYFDHIARSGETFRYTEKGPEGLLKDRPVYIVAARGGVYAGTPADSQTGYLKTILGFMGLHNVQFIYAEGLNMGDEVQQQALDIAKSHINELVAA